jgi:hypothetical protein
MAFSRSANPRSLLPIFFLLAATAAPTALFSQTPSQTSSSQTPVQPGQLPPAEERGVKSPGKTPQGEDRRIFGVLPNYRTAEMGTEVKPLTSKQKLEIATKDSFDYPLIFVGLGYAGLYQLENNHPEFGQGLKGYLDRFATSYADQVIGNFMTEGFMPILLREDPRYFRKAEGTKKSRTFYALSRILVTRTDSGKTTFNFAEVGGNAIAAGIGLAYYPDSRNVSDYMENWGTELLTDATSQVLKEFWPDVKRWWYVKRHKQDEAVPLAAHP